MTAVLLNGASPPSDPANALCIEVARQLAVQFETVRRPLAWRNAGLPGAPHRRAWMHPRRRGDGLTLPALALPVVQLVVPTFDMGHGVAAKDRQLADESPVLAVLTTEGDTPRDWLAAGQALQRLLLAGGIWALSPHWAFALAAVLSLLALLCLVALQPAASRPRTGLGTH